MNTNQTEHVSPVLAATRRVEREVRSLASNPDNLRTIPEEMFLTDILPKVSDETIMADPVLRGRLIEVWARVAGGFTSPVSVRDAEGKHVVTVPPIFDSALYKSELGTQEVDSALEEMHIRTGTLTGFAQQFLERRAIPSFNRRVNSGDFGHSWKPIFEHYRIKSPAAALSSPEQLQTAPVTINPFVEED